MFCLCFLVLTDEIYCLVIYMHIKMCTCISNTLILHLLIINLGHVVELSKVPTCHLTLTSSRARPFTFSLSGCNSKFWNKGLANADGMGGPLDSSDQLKDKTCARSVQDSP